MLSKPIQKGKCTRGHWGKCMWFHSQLTIPNLCPQKRSADNKKSSGDKWLMSEVKWFHWSMDRGEEFGKCDVAEATERSFKRIGSIWGAREMDGNIQRNICGQYIWLGCAGGVANTRKWSIVWTKRCNEANTTQTMADRRIRCVVETPRGKAIQLYCRKQG